MATASSEPIFVGTMSCRDATLASLRFSRSSNIGTRVDLLWSKMMTRRRAATEIGVRKKKITSYRNSPYIMAR
jgi:hypothetical protein